MVYECSLGALLENQTPVLGDLPQDIGQILSRIPYNYSKLLDGANITTRLRLAINIPAFYKSEWEPGE